MARPEDASEIQLDTPALQRRNPKKKTTIKQLFSAASKFQKNLKRYVYIAIVFALKTHFCRKEMKMPNIKFPQEKKKKTVKKKNSNDATRCYLYTVIHTIHKFPCFVHEL